ncbi:AAA family ATPase [Demequina lutea]|uniref:Putative ATPase n=1 Tax=Demequina lutea TaxID=431489 RepID=A0A7Y9ZC33_9MICO|nr:AAA family ATPase [Demequina lutea]NYI42627.1 putative ATPase [Demequina lutea]
MHWRIEDFKGLASGELELAAGTVTVLAGANSSGKSSLLQSLLLTAQSVYQEGPVVLNGSLTRLGEASDLVRNGAETTRIAIRFQGSSDSHWDETVELPIEEAVPEYLAELELRPDGNGGAMVLNEVRVLREDLPDSVLKLSKVNARAGDVAQVAKIIKNKSAEILHVKSLMGSPERPLRTYVAFVGLIPIALVKLETEAQIETRYRTRLMSALRESTQGLSENGIKTVANVPTPELVSASREIWYAMRIRGNDREFQNVLQSSLSRSQGALVPQLMALTATERPRFVDAFANHRARRHYIHIPIRNREAKRGWATFSVESGLLEHGLAARNDESLKALSAIADEFEHLGARVQYLGPLRDEPRVVWTQWNEEARGLPVGARGEFSAAVLSRRAQRAVRYVSPQGVPVTTSLNDAVDSWLAHLQIGEAVATRSRGKLGVGVEVRVGGKLRDLTSVGVGVSQALPLIVAFLSVPDDSVFIVEQPELHLHPAVQARLADFMITSRPQLCVVIETHSESFLTRVRRRAAEGTLDPARVRVTFVEGSDEGARTRVLELSKSGDLSDWPRGFLSGADDDTGAILRENLRRAGADR